MQKDLLQEQSALLRRPQASRVIGNIVGRNLPDDHLKRVGLAHHRPQMCVPMMIPPSFRGIGKSLFF